MKNVAGYDLPKLATGALGTLGVIARAVFRVHPSPKNTVTLTTATPNAQDAQRVILAIQDSKLAHAALQARLASDASPNVDTLFEGTTAGLVGQRTHLESLIAPFTATDATPGVWNSRQGLFSLDAPSVAVAKFSVLPTGIAAIAEAIAAAAQTHQLHWSAVIQATGIGCLRLVGPTQKILTVLQSLRAEMESEGGSLVLLRHPAGMPAFDAWGKTADALPLMRAVKQQLDPRGTLNPGRFVGGI